jgi:hypothetical protein
MKKSTSSSIDVSLGNHRRVGQGYNKADGHDSYNQDVDKSITAFRKSDIQAALSNAASAHKEFGDFKQTFVFLQGLRVADALQTGQLQNTTSDFRIK